MPKVQDESHLWTPTDKQQLDGRTNASVSAPGVDRDDVHESLRDQLNLHSSTTSDTEQTQIDTIGKNCANAPQSSTAPPRPDTQTKSVVMPTSLVENCLKL